MSMLTNEEQLDLLEEDGPTTQKINKRLSEAEDRILKQLAPVVEKQEEIIKKQENQDNLFSGLTKRMTESFGGLLHLDEKLGKK